ncbi:tat pathway signal sequence [Ophiocordyceps camponoti-floridani]|uniref:Tat pathway signal sequence n=1 Tax=Ophiocordyceps camponoti-floridani TaxID=2030778 RepID=A0A8H4VED5_9HYPO|nr:tat pathway signal sequence [Ophiocordyceps camponoti-floridani]
MRTMSIITQYNDAYNPGALPKGPLRVPRRQSRREPFHHQSPYVSPEPSLSTEKESVGADRDFPGVKGFVGAETEDLERRTASLPRLATASVGSSRSCSSNSGTVRQDDKGLFAHRRRAGRFLVLVAVIAIVIVALAVGLAVGLRRNTDSSSGSASMPSNADFPAGSYSFNANVKTTETGCTSQASTWRCASSTSGSSPAANWDIRPRGNGAYTISSPTASDLNPPFTDIALRILDANHPTERLVFTLPFNKTVTPAASSLPPTRAAKCTYQDVQLEATLYTRRRSGRAMAASSRLGQGMDWPGDVEITQHMPSTIGQPTCSDANGIQIADVQAAQGDCSCVYTNN